MSEHKTPRVGAILKSTRVRALLSLGIVLGLTSVSTLAYWTDTAPLSTGTIQSGTIDIQLNNAQSHNATTFAMANMVPGEAMAYGVTVNRAANTIPFTYTITGQTSATNTFAQSLVFTVHAGLATSTTTTNGVRRTVCTGTDISAGGSTLTTTAKALVTARSTLATPTAVSATIYNDPVCIQASLPTGTANGAQGQSTTATFNFNATQLQ